MRAGTLIALAVMTFQGAALAEKPATRPTRVKVSVAPFESLSPDVRDDATLVGAINRSLADELARSRRFDVVDAKSADADFRISGTVQQSDERVRVTGEVFDVRRDEQVGRFKVTGTTRELFEIQDIVADQVRSKLARATSRDGGDSADRESSQREIEPSEPLTLGSRGYRPDWMYPGDVWAGDAGEITRQYNHGLDTYAYWGSPYGLGYYGVYSGYYGGGFSPYFRLYRPYRPIYGGRYDDYTFRGIPDRNFYHRDGFGPRSLRSFTGPVPQRWMRRR